MDTDIDTLVALEWESFQAVHNTGGRASCQDDFETFSIMRKSQFLTWDEPTRESYLRDLRVAAGEGRNLLAEKYARMMAWTAPSEYRLLRDSLPEISAEAAALVEELTAVLLSWQDEYARAYPGLAAKGRPVEGDDSGLTSFETYLRGELMTYSVETLRRYAAHVRRMRERKENMSVTLMEHTVRFYGYASLEEAQARA